MTSLLAKLMLTAATRMPRRPCRPRSSHMHMHMHMHISHAHAHAPQALPPSLLAPPEGQASAHAEGSSAPLDEADEPPLLAAERFAPQLAPQPGRPPPAAALPIQ